MGVLAMFASIGVLFVLPWLDTSKVRSMRYRPMAKLYFLIFLVVCVILGFCGAKLPDHQVIPGLHTFSLGGSDLNSWVWLSRVTTLYYFAFFLVILPLLGLFEKPLPVPETIATPALSHPASVPAEAVAAPEQKG